MKKSFLFIFCSLLLILSACSTQKRLYTKGFYSHRNQTTKKTEAAKADTLPSLALNKPKIKNKTANLVATKSDFIITDFKPIEGCDTIILKNGAKILAAIHEINLTKVLFKNCNSADETIIFIKKSDVSYINFANGSKQVFDTNADFNQPQNLPGQPNINPQTGHGRSNSYDKPKSGKLNTFSLISFIISVVPYPFIIILMALLGLVSITPGGSPHAFSQVFGAPHMSAALLVPFIFVAAAIIMSLIAIYQIKNNGSDNKKGLKLAYIALILSLILLLLLGLFAF
ncbi:MAG: hypothetical protein ABI388_00540 [Bacteroidia bacterium]